MKTLIVLLLGAALGIGAYIYFKEPQNRTELDRAGEQISEGAGQLKEKITESVGELKTEDIREELARTGQVVRKKAAETGARIADATTDAKMTATIKGKFALESDLSALSISVNTTRGVVTLSGSVSSHEQIKKAMRIALATEGVTEVISTLQVQ